MKLFIYAPDDEDGLVVFFFVRAADLSFGLLSDEDDLLLPLPPPVFFPPQGDADDGRKVRPTLLPLPLVLCWEVNTTQ